MSQIVRCCCAGALLPPPSATSGAVGGMDGAPSKTVFPAVKLFNQGYSYTYDDVIFHPGYIDFPADAVQLGTKLSRNVHLSNTLRGVADGHRHRICHAVAMATVGASESSTPTTPLRSRRRWSVPPSRACSFRVGSSCEVRVRSVDSVSDFGSAPYVLVTESGTAKSKMLGVVLRSDWEIER
ncbi:Inosine-5'-monophosphate dehydrogenase [Vitis vinifera]|uniref:Inosine-5'-monophosphate dehydrogenase n=1 Tax=Vitis vinifera TaxID=29760 RepID=A0A438IB35_VITVI|nr:Inosine-5'-monophosphate dehydrogenase [Vitis vinifera]